MVRTSIQPLSGVRVSHNGTESVRALSCSRKRPTLVRVVTLGCVPVSMAYCSAGRPNASQPIGCSTLWPSMRCGPAVVQTFETGLQAAEWRGGRETPPHLVASNYVCGCVALWVADMQTRATAAARLRKRNGRKKWDGGRGGAPGVRKHIQNVILGFGHVDL